MTKKHFEAIAKILNARRVAGETAIRLVANDLAHEFAQYNPNFDRDRFLAACGVA